ncbi:MAG: hypothetical protein NVS3B3_15540 [Aquirhabdus sp.]
MAIDASTDVFHDSEKLELGKRIRKLREEHIYTLDQLSQITKQIDPLGDGISKVSISRYENGDSYPGYREIRLIAQAFAMPITSFFYGDKPDPFGEWNMSLDEYLRQIIKDELIENGLIEGRSIRQKEQDKTKLMRDVNLRRKPLSLDSDPKEQKWVEDQKKQRLDQILLESIEDESANSKGKKRNK